MTCEAGEQDFVKMEIFKGELQGYRQLLEMQGDMNLKYLNNVLEFVETIENPFFVYVLQW